MTIGIEHVNVYLPIRFEIRIVAAYWIRTEISDSQVPKNVYIFYRFISKLDRNTIKAKMSSHF